MIFTAFSPKMGRHLPPPPPPPPHSASCMSISTFICWSVCGHNSLSDYNGVHGDRLVGLAGNCWCRQHMPVSCLVHNTMHVLILSGSQTQWPYFLIQQSWAMRRSGIPDESLKVFMCDMYCMIDNKWFHFHCYCVIPLGASHTPNK